MNTMNPSTPDLTHADWLMFSTQELIHNVNENISTEIVSSQGKRLIFVSGVSEADIDNLYFLTNTDQNNNYLYLETFSIVYEGSNNNVNIPGLEIMMKNNFRQSDIAGFVSDNKLHYPFTTKNFKSSSFTGNTLSEFIDQYTSLVPFAASTYGKVKTYSFVLNPDCEKCSQKEENEE